MPGEAVIHGKPDTLPQSCLPHVLSFTKPTALNEASSTCMAIQEIIGYPFSCQNQNRFSAFQKAVLLLKSFSKGNTFPTNAMGDAVAK